MSRKRLASERLTDLGNARRLVTLYGQDLRFVHAWGWLFWDGKRWRRDEIGEIHRRAKQTARAIWKEATAATNPDEKVALSKHARASERSSVIDAMIKLASTEPEIIAMADQFDAEPMLLTVNNGTIDLRTGELLPHRREDLVTKLVPVNHDPAATCPRFDGFLKTIMADDEEMIGFLRRAFGYSLTGDTREQCLFFLNGLGSNGKGALMRIFETLLGDHFRKTPFETLIERKSETIREDVADLAGARFVSAEEKSGASHRFDEGLVKTLTGQDTISTRFLHKNRFTFRPAFKIWLAANRKPRIVGTDHGIWRRIRLIPFTVTIDKPDPSIEITIRGIELPGVLGWAVRGCLEWQQQGLREPNEVRAATREYREEQDVLGEFFTDCCHMDNDVAERSSALYARYHAWAVEHGYRNPMSQTAFGLELSDRGFKGKRDGSGLSVRSGLRLLAPTTSNSSNGSNGSNGSSENSPETLPCNRNPENRSNYSNHSKGSNDDYELIERLAISEEGSL